MSEMIVALVACAIGYWMGLHKANRLLALLADPAFHTHIAELVAMCREKKQALDEQDAARAVMDPLYAKSDSGQKLSVAENNILDVETTKAAAGEERLLRARSEWQRWHPAITQLLGRYGDGSSLRNTIVSRTDPPA